MTRRLRFRFLSLAWMLASVSPSPIALPLGSPSRKNINRALLEKVSAGEGSDVLYRYPGVTP